MIPYLLTLRAVPRFLLISGVSAALLFAGCALNPDDGGGGGGGGGGDVTLDRTTRTNLITQYLPAAYSQMDSTAYDEALDDGYIFELLPEDPDPSVPPPWWDRNEELLVAGNMFNARYNTDNQRVERIELSMTVKTDAVDNNNYPGKPPGETWYKITALVDLLVVVENPLDTEGGVTNFVVQSDQIFTVRNDPDADSLWVVYKQVDQESIN